MVSTWQCCAADETIEHLFLHSQLARNIWELFHDMLGIQKRPFDSLKEVIFHRMQKARGMGHIYMLFPMIIMWAIWVARNNAKFEGVHVSSIWITTRANALVSMLGKGMLLKEKQRKGALQLANHFSFSNVVVRQLKVIRWTRSAPGRHKLNTDRAMKGSSGIGGGGLIIRDAQGECLYAGGVFLGKVTVVEVEIKALVARLWFCIRMGINNIDIEFDSLAIKHLVNSGNGHWQISQELDSIIAMIRASGSTISHIY